MDEPKYPPVNPTVTKSVQKPNAFAKPGSTTTKASTNPANNRSTRFRPTNEKQRGRRRKRNDPRRPIFY